MQSLLRLVALTATIALAVPTGASAQWQTTVDGPDVFGNVKAIAISGGLRQSMIIQCDQKEDLFIAFIERKKEFEDWGETAAEFLIQIDSSQPIKLKATLRDWNNNYVGVVASGRTVELVSVISAISTAQTKINIGWVVRGRQNSASISASGSTAAAASVIKNCKLDAIGR